MTATSVIVCTYRRPELLERLLDSFRREAPSARSDWELVLVDNGGAPETARAVERAGGGLPLRLVREARVGKSYALNAGVDTARGELMLFTDDDVELRTGWLGAFVAEALRAPKAGWFGGRSIPRWGEGAPRWVERGLPDALRGYSCLYDLGDTPREYGAGDLLPIGASMAVRASTFRAIGGFDTRLGPQEGRRGVGEDTDLVLRAMARGIAGRYVPDAVVDHLVPATRLAPMAILRYGLLKGRQQAIAAGRRASRAGAARRVAEQCARGLVQWLRGRPELASVCWLNVGLAVGAARRPAGESTRGSE